MADKRPCNLFQFPQARSTVLPDPFKFFSPKLSTPFPTNSFFQNFVLQNGDQPEYIHPYLIKSSHSSLSISYPSRDSSPSFIYQYSSGDLTISALKKTNPNSTEKHVITSYSDLSVTLDIPASNMRFFLVRGSPFVTASVKEPTALSFTTDLSILSFFANNSNKYTVQTEDCQIWLIYTSSPINFSHTDTEITSEAFSGIIRVAVLPDANTSYEATLDSFSSCYPISGDATFTNPFTLEYKWERQGWGDLLMLAHPLHLELLSTEGSDVTVLQDFKYNSIDGDLVGVVGDSWILKADPISVTWHSSKGVKEESYNEIRSALYRDVQGVNSTDITTTSSYDNGKLIARAARLALIAEEVCFQDVIPAVEEFLKETIEPWLNGTIGIGFLYDGKWGGIVTKQGSTNSLADSGFGIYDNHHGHLGYFLYGIAVLAKIDPTWGSQYKCHAYSLMADFMNLPRQSNSTYPRLRCFDLYKLHSWAGGPTESADGRNQQSTSEAVNAYYSAALMGLAYGDSRLVSIGSTLAAFEIHAAQTWYQIRFESRMYEEEFTRENRITGTLWNNKRTSMLRLPVAAMYRVSRLAFQVLPLSPITEALYSDVGYVKELVEWTKPALSMGYNVEGLMGFVFALEAIFDRKSALENTRNLMTYDSGNSLTNLLWWIHSRDDEDDEGFGQSW